MVRSRVGVRARVQDLKFRVTVRNLNLGLGIVAILTGSQKKILLTCCLASQRESTRH